LRGESLLNKSNENVSSTWLVFAQPRVESTGFGFVNLGSVGEHSVLGRSNSVGGFMGHAGSGFVGHAGSGLGLLHKGIPDISADSKTSVLLCETVAKARRTELTKMNASIFAAPPDTVTGLSLLLDRQLLHFTCGDAVEPIAREPRLARLVVAILGQSGIIRHISAANTTSLRKGALGVLLAIESDLTEIQMMVWSQPARLSESAVKRGNGGNTN